MKENGKTKTTNGERRVGRKVETGRNPKKKPESGSIENSSKKENNRKGSKEITPKIYVGLTIAGVRIMPMLISAVIVITTILSYFDLYYPFFNMFFSAGYMSLLCLWILSKTYRFCLYHRLFIYHAATFQTITWIDTKHPFPLEDIQFVAGILIMSAVFFAGALWAHMKYGDREAPKR